MKIINKIQPIGGFNDKAFGLNGGVTNAKTSYIGGSSVSQPIGSSTGLSRNFMSGNLGKTISMGASSLSSMNTIKDNQSEESFALQQGAHSALQSAGPWGAAISMVAGATDKLAEQLNIGGEFMNEDAAERMDINGAGMNNLLLSLPGTRFATSMFAKGVDEGFVSDQTKSMGASYGGSVKDVQAGKDLGGKKYLFGAGKANKAVAESNRVNTVITGIADESNKRKGNTIGQNVLSQNQNRYSGINTGLNLAKNGMKIPDIDLAKKIIENVNKKNKRLSFNEYLKIVDKDKLNDNYDLKLAYESSPEFQDEWIRFAKEKDYHAPTSVSYNKNKDEYIIVKSKSHPTYNKEVDWYNSSEGSKFKNDYELIESDSLPSKYVRRKAEKFKSGGKIKSVIVDGALHGRLNNMDLDVTEKGIPVVVINEDGGVIQHAEVEKEELILSKEITDKLEELYKENTEESAILAGKLLSREIVKNTIDKTKNIL